MDFCFVNGIIAAFVAGLVRSVSDYISKTDEIDLDEVPDRHTILPIPYHSVLEAVEYELGKNFYIPRGKYEKWLIKTRQIFWEEEFLTRDARNDGFTFMVYDLFDDLIKRWRSPELITPTQKQYLSGEIVVTRENVNELLAEITMYKDLVAGKVKMKEVDQGNIDSRLAIMFSHLNHVYRDKLRRKVLERQ